MAVPFRRRCPPPFNVLLHHSRFLAVHWRWIWHRITRTWANFAKYRIIKKFLSNKTPRIPRHRLRSLSNCWKWRIGNWITVNLQGAANVHNFLWVLNYRGADIISGNWLRKMKSQQKLRNYPSFNGFHWMLKKFKHGIYRTRLVLFISVH